jgi:hypothetical protein
MPDERSSKPAVQAEHRNEVRRRQRHGWQPVQVGAIRGVEIERRHGVSEEGGVHMASHPVAVLIGLNRDHGGLGSTGQSGYPPRVGVCFF